MVWPASFVGMRGINDMWFDNELVAADFSGSIGVGDIATGSVVQINQALTAQSGSYNNAQLVGHTVFASRYNGYRTDWWVWQGGTPRLFLGDENTDIAFLMTDGAIVIWKQGSEPLDQPNSVPVRIYQRYDLYWSPYAPDAGALQPKLLLANVPRNYSQQVLQNGYLAGIYEIASAPLHTGAIVVRSSDGKAWRSVLPGSYSWNAPLFPAGTELWGAVTASVALLKSETIVRYPYAAMEILQAQAP